MDLKGEERKDGQDERRNASRQYTAGGEEEGEREESRREEKRGI